MKKARDFQFKQFTVAQDKATHKVGTDGVLLGAWVNVSSVNTILDVGAGTGLIALMLAQRTDNSTAIHGVELQKQDAEQALLNVKNSPWKERITIHNTAVQDFHPNMKFDLIVSNPPYFIKSALPPTTERSIVRHTESLSFEELVLSAKRLITTTGHFALILPCQESLHFKNISGIHGFHCIRECLFRSRAHKPVERVLLEFSLQQAFKRNEEMILYGDGDEWSTQYKELTKAFYLKL